MANVGYFFLAIVTVLTTWELFNWFWRRRLAWPVETRGQALTFLIICALPAAVTGQLLVHTFSGFLSWYVGVVAASWLMYRLARGDC